MNSMLFGMIGGLFTVGVVVVCVGARPDWGLRILGLILWPFVMVFVLIRSMIRHRRTPPRPLRPTSSLIIHPPTTPPPIYIPMTTLRHEDESSWDFKDRGDANNVV